jgi:hypothetical protein
MDLNKKDVMQIAGGVIGFFLFIYLIILAIPPIEYFTYQWSQKWEIIK